MDEFADKVTLYFQENPGNYGIILVVIGIVLLIGTIRRWNWVVGETRHTSFGLFLIEIFGEKYIIIRMYFLSILFIVLGIGWFLLYQYT